MISVLVDYLAIFCQTGDLAQLELIARTILSAIPEDLVALQFLGLALYQMGRVEDAHRVFERVPASLDRYENWGAVQTCEPAAVATLREATRVHSGLAEGWHRIAFLLTKFGLHKPASRAVEAALAAGGLERRLAVDRRNSNTED